MDISGSKQFETEVIGVISRTKDVISVRFRRPDGFDYLSGQWAFVSVGSEKGQEMKPLSLSSSPTESFIEFTKRLTGHVFSNAFAAMKVGDKALINGPRGKLTLPSDYKKICMLSGGIGITPLRSMIKYSTDMQLKTSIVLLYSNRFEDSIVFMDDFNEMLAKNPNLKVIITITKPSQNWKGLTGRIDRDMIEKYVLDYDERVFYSCGPRPMVDTMVAMLGKMGVPEGQLRYEYFSGYLGVSGGESAQ